jgi:hypothetical protein
MIISHSRRFTFVHIHKAGGTSIEMALDPHLAWNDLILGSSPLGQGINRAYRTRHGLYKHSSVAEIQKLCGSQYIEEYYLFALVRNPIHRVCSLYNFVGSSVRKLEELHKIDLRAPNILTRKNLLKKIPTLNWPATRVFLASSSFSDFIRDDNLVREPGFHPQTTRLTCPDTGQLKAEIYKLEEITKSADAMRRRLGIDFELVHENKSRVTLIEPRLVSREDRTYLEEKFSADFSAFGY